MIREIRKAKHITQMDLAKALGISRFTITNWEHGRTAPNSKMLKKLSILLEVPVSTLLKGL